MANEIPPIGAWAKVGTLVGLVSRIDGDTAVLFNPGLRQETAVPVADLTILPASALTITVSADLPVPHGLAEDELRRWVSSLIDDAVRERARDALADRDLDVGPSLPEVEFSVGARTTDGGLCLCGKTTPTPDGQPVACAGCGRKAVPPP